MRNNSANHSPDNMDKDDSDTKILRAALEVIVKTQCASTSNLQRALRLGYTRAAHVMGELERRSCIGPATGPGGRREILRASLDGYNVSGENGSDGDNGGSF